MTAPPGDLAEMRERLTAHVAEVQDEITRGHLHRQLFNEVRTAIIAEHPESDGTFLFSYGEVYAHSQALLVRRMADRSDSKPNSLWWALERVRRNPGIADRASFVSLIPKGLADDSWERRTWLARNDSDFTEMWGPGSVPADERLQELQVELLEAATPVVQWVDGRVAHRDRLNKEFVVRFADIDSALDCLYRIANHLSVLLTSSSRLDHVAIQGDWKAPLRASLWPAEKAQRDAWEAAMEARATARRPPPQEPR